MGAPVADLGLLLDAISQVQTFVTVFISVYSGLILAYIITSWIKLPYSLNKFQRFLFDVGEPYLRLFRRVLPSFGPLDFSPAIGLIVLWVFERIVNGVILERLH